MLKSFMKCSARLIRIGFVTLVFATSLNAAEQQDLEASIRFASERGSEIYERDQAAWLATDAALSAGLQQPAATGWITVRTEAGWLVRFIAFCNETPCSVLDVNLKNNRPTASLLDPPEQLSERQRNAWRARQLALSTRIDICSDRYNTVAIPTEDGKWVVYLLAATTNPKAVLLGGHHRLTISANGHEVLEKRAFSNTCLTLKKDAGVAALYATHVLDPYPVETHVFASLLHHVPIYIGTENGMFVVEGKAIRKDE